MIALYMLINTILDLFFWILILSAILSWLVAFNVVNTRNRAVYLIGDFLYRITEPVLRPIRRVLPNMGGLDLSPIVVLLAISFIQNLMAQYWPRF
ncbi:YggT family protein [Azospirillum ramasamyi]|uniref:YggT family protein n=1 Tax=Azospirillum ramasamyi TaxID=682998 RepID=A0A2U9S5Z6_9PROT|nr:YggT family protein [Azospirillum ramasamyi]AWU94802.1 YggT family protein [Azospirillum ramasamyi]